MLYSLICNFTAYCEIRNRTYCSFDMIKKITVTLILSVWCFVKVFNVQILLHVKGLPIPMVVAIVYNVTGLLFVFI